MENNKGFTLIELLAVILILGIISLIAIPTVNKIIKESRKGAFESSVNNIVGAIEDECQLQSLKGEVITSTYTFTNGVVSPSLNVNGDLPTIGTATVDANCMTTINVTNGSYVATKTLSDDSVTLIEGDEIVITYNVYPNGTAIYFNPVSGVTCAAGAAVSSTGTKTGCMKWYTFNDGGSSSETVNLILDHNTTSLVAWNSTGNNTSGPNELMIQLQTDTSSWSNELTRTDSYSVNNGTATYTINYSTYKARLITAAEIATISGNSSFVEATTPYTSWFYLDSNNQTQIATTTGASNYDWLFDYTNSCTSYGCNIADASNYGYWTSTATAGDAVHALHVNRGGNLSSNYVDDIIYFGVRPVITVLKNNF